MAHILVLEDDLALSAGLCFELDACGHLTVAAYHCEKARQLLEKEAFDLALFDVNLPDGSGFDLCREVKEKYPNLPVLFLTANDLEEDVLKGFDLGADDYITKPFNPLELVARVKTQLRRYLKYNGSGGAGEITEYDIRGLQISKTTHKCMLFGEELALTPLEFSILWYLCAHQGKVVSSEELFEAVWGEKFMDSNNTVMSHIARLREKMHENSKKPKFIKTVWGVGYTIV